MRARTTMPTPGSQPQQASQAASQGLPGIDWIMSQVGHDVECPRCHRFFLSTDMQHECYKSGTRPSKSSSFAQSYTDTHIELMSTTSSPPNLHSELPTPVSSRSGSISGSPDGGYASSAESPDDRICSKCGPACTNTKHKQGENKKGKEKRARKDQAEVLQNAEDMFTCIFGFKPIKTQSAGNGNAAGVETPKIELLRILEFLALMGLEKELMNAIEAGREEQWKAEIRYKVSAFLARWYRSEQHPHGPSYDPSFDGSVMELSDKRPCKPFGGKGANAKKCSTHPNSGFNYVDCRKDHHVRDFAKKTANKRRRCN